MPGTIVDYNSPHEVCIGKGFCRAGPLHVLVTSRIFLEGFLITCDTVINAKHRVVLEEQKDFGIIISI